MPRFVSTEVTNVAGHNLICESHQEIEVRVAQSFSCAANPFRKFLAAEWRRYFGSWIQHADIMISSKNNFACANFPKTNTGSAGNGSWA
jgi:hypothetical protein